MGATGLIPDSSARIAFATLSGRSVDAAGDRNVADVKEKARKTAEDFEAVFLSAMFKQMFSGLKTDGPFGGGYGEEVFREMLADEYARDVARSGGIGLADQVYREMLALQEIKP